KENFKELQNRIKSVSEREAYLEVVEWVNKNAPGDGNEEKYDHVTAILEQMSREPKTLPKLHIAKKPFDQLTIDDFVVENYNPHPPIRRKMAV
ncbi:MAG: thymidylate synthase, partial [Bacteroidales bacterium]|nr:thymidylate synthase [Bacteroidales bacterium]